MHSIGAVSKWYAFAEKVWCAIQLKFMKGVMEIAIHDKFAWPVNSKYPCGEDEKNKQLCANGQDQILLTVHSIELTTHLALCAFYVFFYKHFSSVTFFYALTSLPQGKHKTHQINVLCAYAVWKPIANYILGAWPLL